MENKNRTDEIRDSVQNVENENSDLQENNETPEEDVQTEQEKCCNQDLEDLKAQLDEKTKKCDEYFSLAQRMAAEFENYKRRTAREKEALYVDATSDVVAAFLPVIDNLERAVQAAAKEGDGQSLKEGIELVLKQINDVLKNLGVEEIKSVGEKFDPQLHNAVMHVDDDTQSENSIVEEFRKGYMIKDRVIRHSMVKVAN